MTSWRLALLLGTAVAAGIGAWALVRPADTADDAPRASPDTPSAVEDSLQEAANNLKAADGAVGHQREIAIEAARRRLRDLTLEAPRDPRVAFWSGMGAVFAKDEQGARADHSRMRTLPGVTARDPAWRYLGAMIVLEFEPQKPEPALRALRALQAEAPRYMPEPVDRAVYRALLQTAVVRVEPREAESVVQLVKEAVERAKDDPVRAVESRRMLAYAYSRAGRYVEAQEQWEWLVERSEGQAADFLAGLGNGLAMQNQWERAVEAFGRALVLRAKGQAMRMDDPALDEILLRRGNCYRLLGRTDLARADFEAHLATHPEDHRAMYWLGTLFLDPLDEPERARDHLEKARALAPYCDSYLRLLLQVYEMRQPDAAKAADLRKVIEEGADARKKERERMGKEHREGRFICE
ncbi:MAG TPA: tetratricopeptide repeat protein [Planctomycetota bacterium]|nr:tetratricopeptide repeat protein [Planctomycetota bacterium]